MSELPATMHAGQIHSYSQDSGEKSNFYTCLLQPQPQTHNQAPLPVTVILFIKGRSFVFYAANTASCGVAANVTIVSRGSATSLIMCECMATMVFRHCPRCYCIRCPPPPPPHKHIIIPCGQQGALSLVSSFATSTSIFALCAAISFSVKA